MNIQEVILEQNKHWHVKHIDTGIERKLLEDVKKSLNVKHIITITGARRSGKSFLLRQIIDYLIHKKNIKPENIFYANFEDPVFIEIKNDPQCLQKIFDQYLQLKKTKGRQYVFLDELQNMNKWQFFLRNKYELEGKNIKFIITGSNANLLSSDIATHLTGITLTYEMYPFSFHEYLKAHKIHHVISKNTREVYEKNFKDRNTLVYHLNKYMKEGGFPELLFIKEKEIKKKILKQYFEDIIFRDIIPRFGIRNFKHIELLAHYLFSNFTSLFSFNKLAEYIKSNENTVKEYMSFFEKSYFLFMCNHFDYSLKTQSKKNKKVYCIDNGLRTAISFQFLKDYGKAAENLTYLFLKKHYHNVFYWQDTKGNEVDFIVQTENRKFLGFNVIYSDVIKQREFEGIEHFIKTHKNIGEMFIISKNVFLMENNIQIVPLWSLLLKDYA